MSVREQSSGSTMSGVTSAAILLVAFDTHFLKNIVTKIRKNSKHRLPVRHVLYHFTVSRRSHINFFNMDLREILQNLDTQ